MTEYETVLEAASRLAVAERLLLIEELTLTVEPPDDAHFELSPEWMAEIRRRVADLDAGRTKTIPWEEVKAKMNAVLEARRDTGVPS